MESGNEGDDDDSKRSQKKVANKGGRPRGKKRGAHSSAAITINRDLKKRKIKEN